MSVNVKLKDSDGQDVVYEGINEITLPLAQGGAQSFSLGGGGGTVAGVTTFKGRTGDVVPAAGDYNISQISGASTVASSGSYEDLSNKPFIPTSLENLREDITHRLVTDAEKVAWNSKGTYSKPTAGIPKSDLTAAVQSSLDKADSALQSETYLGTVTGIKMNNGSPKNPDSSGIVNLGTVITSHQDISGKANTSYVDSEIYRVESLVPTVVDNVTTVSSTDALSAKQGKELNERINNLQGIGRYLSLWNCSTGLPLTNPGDLPYSYHSGDYYRITDVSTSTNYMPTGTVYTGSPSTTPYSGEITLADLWFFDGTTWVLQKGSSGGGGGTVQDVYVDGSSVLSGNIAYITLPVVSNKQDKPASATTGHIAVFNNGKNTIDSGNTFVTSVTSSSTNSEIPGAKAVYDLFQELDGGSWDTV